MSDFLTFAKSNNAAKVRSKQTLCRLWQRGSGFTSGNSSKGETYWVSGNKLLKGDGVNLTLDKCKPVADLKEGTLTEYGTGEIVPVLRGMYGSSEILVRVNTLAQKQERVKKAQEEGRTNASVATMPDIYIQIFSYDLTNKSKVEGSEVPDMPSEEVEF